MKRENSKRALALAGRLKAAGYTGKAFIEALRASRRPTWCTLAVLAEAGVPEDRPQEGRMEKSKRLLGEDVHSQMMEWIASGLTDREVLVCLAGLGKTMDKDLLRKIAVKVPLSPEAAALRKESVDAFNKEAGKSLGRKYPRRRKADSKGLPQGFAS